MASLDPRFHEETRSIHDEHEELVRQLDQLDEALEQITCYAEIFTDLATANQAISRGKWMAEWLPRHYAHEETTVLETIARMSPLSNSLWTFTTLTAAAAGGGGGGAPSGNEIIADDVCGDDDGVFRLRTHGMLAERGRLESSSIPHYLHVDYGVAYGDSSGTDCLEG